MKRTMPSVHKPLGPKKYVGARVAPTPVLVQGAVQLPQDIIERVRTVHAQKIKCRVGARVPPHVPMRTAPEEDFRSTLCYRVFVQPLASAFLAADAAWLSTMPAEDFAPSRWFNAFRAERTPAHDGYCAFVAVASTACLGSCTGVRGVSLTFEAPATRWEGNTTLVDCTHYDYAYEALVTEVAGLNDEQPYGIVQMSEKRAINHRSLAVVQDIVDTVSCGGGSRFTITDVNEAVRYAFHAEVASVSVTRSTPAEDIYVHCITFNLLLHPIQLGTGVAASKLDRDVVCANHDAVPAALTLGHQSCAADEQPGAP